MKRALIPVLIVGHAGLLACASPAGEDEPTGTVEPTAEGTRVPEVVQAYEVADPSAPPITAENLLENDAFWPFHAALVRDWTPPGSSQPLPRVLGALIRVSSRETLRVDFGRFGLHEMPIAATDVVEQANRVRRGELTKMAPNLVLTIGNKLLDTRSEVASNYYIMRDTRIEAILCVFADPSDEDFPSVAEALRGFERRGDVITVVFPQSRWKDSGVWRRLRELDWKVPFVIRRFSRPYRRSIAGEETPLPHVMLLTRDGRVLHRGPVAPDVAASIEKALPIEVRE